MWLWPDWAASCPRVCGGRNSLCRDGCRSSVDHLAQQRGYFAIQGDAILDASLFKLGIDRAICLVTALPTDAENLYTVLSAKTLNPRIRTIARANTEEGIQKLQRGGADAVISPYVPGGRRMAAAALHPQAWILWMAFSQAAIAPTMWRNICSNPLPVTV
ncbi:potassium channel family protein [Trichothermofontia sichuanensis]|uniref:potassium channel family protein n=1 Tax=Trichothermofontia sichuanensis TaxID=3045816 RepID=UPI0036F23AB5